MVPPPDAPLPIPYTVFKEQVAAGNVAAIYAQGATVEGQFVEAVTYPPPRCRTACRRAERANASEPRTSTAFTTTVPAFVDPGLEALLIDNGVEISAVPIRSGEQPAHDFAVRLRSGAALDRLLCLDLPPRRAAGRNGRSGRLDGHGPQPSATLRPGGRREGHVRRRCRYRRSRERAHRDRRLPQRARPLHALGRHGAERRAARRRAGHRQDAARESGRRRGWRAVLLDERRGVHGDDRRRRRRARARSFQASARACARDHLHRRARRDRPRARPIRARRLERAGTDAESDPDRDGRVLEPRRRHRARGDQSARGARQGAAAARAASIGASS